MLSLGTCAAADTTQAETRSERTRRRETYIDPPLHRIIARRRNLETFCAKGDQCLRATGCHSWLIQVFENAGGAHAAADAHGDQSVASAAAFEFADDACGKLRAGAA